MLHVVWILGVRIVFDLRTPRLNFRIADASVSFVTDTVEVLLINSLMVVEDTEVLLFSQSDSYG